MAILYLKAFHIVFVVAWFAGLFYLLRMFVYYREAEDKGEPDRSILTAQFLLMQKRVFKIIAEPAMGITWTLGTTIICLYGWEWFSMSYWLHAKLVFLFFLSWFHIYCGQLIKKFESGTNTFSSQQLRMMNEVPTLFLLCIALLAMLKNLEYFAMAIPVILLFGFLIFKGIKFYKAFRQKNPSA